MAAAEARVPPAAVAAAAAMLALDLGPADDAVLGADADSPMLSTTCHAVLLVRV
jgi:hypothetical protein